MAIKGLLFTDPEDYNGVQESNSLTDMGGKEIYYSPFTIMGILRLSIGFP